MISCNVCYEWRPTDYRVWRYIDDKAYCCFKQCDTNRMDTCEHGSIVKPGGIDVKQVIGKPVKQETTTNSSGSIIRSELADKHDSGFSQNLFAHQLEAVERYKDSSVIPLFLECGLGKTATVLKIVEYKFKRHEINALLVIAPNQVHNQWAKQEIPRWLDVPYDLQIIGGVGGQKVTRLFDTDPQMLQIVCTNVDTFSTKDKWKEIVEWALYNKTFIVLDEATSIKSIKAKRTERILYSFNKIAKRGKTIVSSVPLTPARAVLTGTPVTNGPMDLWSIMEFVQPNFFGRNWYSFQSYYSMFTSLNIADRVIKVPLTEDTWTSIKRILSYNEANYVFGISEDTFNTIHNQDHYEGPYKHADELKAKLDTVATFKRLKDCVDMPEQNYIVKELTMSSELKSCYDQMADEYIALYKEHTMTAQNKLTVLIRLQQLSSGFMLSKPQDDVSVETHDHVSDLFGLLDTQDVMPQEVVWIGSNNPKLEQLYSDVAEICKPLIIITRFTAEASRIYDELRDKYKVALFTGWKKVGTVQEFQRGEYEIMVANVAVVARGFNLQNANTILFYSNTYSLELRLQAEGRIYRIGQKNTCRYIDYAYKNSIDEKIVAALLMKRNLLEFLQSADIEDILEQTRVG